MPKKELMQRDSVGQAGPAPGGDPARLDEMAARLARLERAHRAWKRAAVGLSAGLVLLVGVAAVRAPDVVEAESFVLRDRDGVMRAALAMRPDQTAGLGLFDRRGNVQLSLDLGPDGSAGLNLYGTGGKLRAALAIRPDGTPGLGLFDERGRVRRSVEIGPGDGAGPGPGGVEERTTRLPRSPEAVTPRTGSEFGGLIAGSPDHPRGGNP